nr:MAG TPA: minor tail protein [Caudoviricetes sp.]
MADNTIDTLDIQIESSAAKAIQSINGLIKKFEVLNKSLNGINTGALRNYSKELGRVTVALNSISSLNISTLDKTIDKLNTLSKINLSNLQNQKISLDLDIKGGDQTQKLQYAIDKTIQDVKVDTSAISGQLISAFNLKGGAASKIRAQMNELSKTMASSYDGTDILAKLNDTLNNIANTIIKSGSVVKGNLGSYLDGAEQEWVDFYNFFKNKRIYVSDMLKTDVGKGEFSELLKENLSNVVRDAAKGINLNESWGELADRFPTLIPKDTINAADQLITVLENLKKARDSIKPISIQELSGKEATQASDKVWEMSVDAYDQLAQKIRDRIQNTLKSTNGQLPIDVKINTDKIVLDIQKAINKAADLKYNTVNVTLDADVTTVKDAITKKLKDIDAGEMTDLSTSMAKFATSLRDLGSVNFKGTGLNAVINSINRLGKSDFSQFDTGKLGEILTEMQKLDAIPDVSPSVSRFTTAIAKLAGTGQYIGNVSKELPSLATGLNNAAAKLGSMSEVSASTNAFITSLGKLASAGDKTGKTASQLSTLAQEVLKFFDVMKSAPDISSSTIRMTEALAVLASSGSKVGRATSSVSSSLNNLSSVGSKVSSVMHGVANAFQAFASKTISLGGKAVSAIAGIGNASSETGEKIRKLSNPLSSLTNKLSALYAKGFLVKRALEVLSSPVESAMNYVETLNYFNSAFNQVAEGIDTDEWKKSGIKSAEAYANSFQERAKQLSQKLTGFEISDTGELTRTNTASLGLDPEKAMQYQATFAQMSSSMGDTSETALKLSNALTMIGSDLASVRNMDFEDVWEDMASGLTGMSRTMDKYGINIRNANMQQELYNLGINTSISNLSQADKTILRTIILLNNSKYAWGDLANTINQPANQIRMLQSNFASLGRTIGSLFIPILRTVLPYINAIVIALQRMFAYIAKLLGIKLSNFVSSTGGISVDTSNIADDMDNASGSIDTANKNAKKLEKTLSVLSFDELNQLNDNSDSGSTSNPSSGSGNGGLGHIGALDAALDDALSAYQKAWDEAFKKMSNRANKMADAIVNAFKRKDWKGLGKIMADGINWGMQKLYDAINWNKVGPYITKFTSAFTQTFNSLVDNINWNLMGRTVGAGLNTIVNMANQLLEGTDFKNLGKKFAEGVTGFIREVEWTNLGNMLGNNFMKAWDVFTGFVENLPYNEIGQAVANGLNGIFEKVDFGEIAHALATGLNGAFDSLAAFTDNFNWNDFVDNITSGIVTFMQEFDWKENGQKLENFINHLLTSLIDIAKGVDWESFGHNVGVFLSQIEWGKHLSQLLTVVGDVLGGIWEGLGTTSAGTFVQAMAVFAIGDKLMPLVDTITKFFTGDTVFGNLSKAVQSMLNPAITEAVKTTIPALGTSLGSLVATGGGIALAVGGAVLLTKKLAGLFETMQGGNGMTTQYGGYLHDYATQLTDVANLTNDQSEALWQLIEKDEELGKTHDEMYSDMVEKLKEYGVSADQAKTALEQYGAQAGVSAEFVEGMTNKISALGDGMSEAASKFDTSKISISDLKDELYMLSLKSDEFGGSYKTAMDELDNANNGGAITNTKDALDKVYTSLKNAGVPLDELNKKLREDFPNAAVATKTAVEQNIVGAQETISSSVAKASKDTKTATSEMTKNATDDFAEIQKQADTYMGNVATTTSMNWGNSSREATVKAREMKVAVSTELGNMDKSVRRHFESQYNIAYVKWENIGRDISNYISGTMNSDISSALGSFVDTIRNSFSNMYDIGYNAMQNLANGMKSVNIQTPHMYMDMTASVNGNKHSYKWNSGVNWYATGGVFTKASVIGVGEAGQEAVLPLENRKAMKSIADSIMSGYDGNMGLTKEEIMEAVERGVVTAMMNNGGFGGSSPEYIMNSIKVNERELARIVTKAQSNTEYRMNPSPAY